MCILGFYKEDVRIDCPSMGSILFVLTICLFNCEKFDVKIFFLY